MSRPFFPVSSPFRGETAEKKGNTAASYSTVVGVL